MPLSRVRSRLAVAAFACVALHPGTHAFSDDFVDTYAGESAEWKYPWGLPAILDANKRYDERLANCIDGALPGSLCKPGKHRRISVDTKDPVEPAPAWEGELRRHQTSLRREAEGLAVKHLDRFVPYCHHHDDCPNPSWRIMPLMVLKLKVPSNLALVPVAAKLLSFMEEHIPGLITAVLSLSAAHGHITPHCGGVEGFQFVRHHLALLVPEPKARFRICGRVYEFEEGQLMGFNNSIPHEVINPAADPRIVLLFDVLLPDIMASPKGHSETMTYLGEKWGQTLRDLRHMNNMTQEAYNNFIISKVHRQRRLWNEGGG